MTEKIKKTEAFLREKLKESPYFQEHPEAGAYRLEHTFRVARIGMSIARAEGMDPEALAMACLLHDVSYCRWSAASTQEDWLNHGRESARIARPFLESLGLPPDVTGEICYGVAIHVDDKADFPGEATAFAQTVGDADNIDRFEEMGMDCSQVRIVGGGTKSPLWCQMKADLLGKEMTCTKNPEGAAIGAAMLASVAEGNFKSLDEAAQQMVELGQTYTPNPALKAAYDEAYARYRACYAAMDAFVLPSLFEGLPVVLVEAQTAGLPCFVSDTVDRDAAFADGVQFLPLQDPAAWAEAICASPLTRNPKARQQAEDAGYDVRTSARILQQFYIKRYAEVNP